MGQFGAGGSVFGATAAAEPGNGATSTSFFPTSPPWNFQESRKKAKEKWPEGALPRGALVVNLQYGDQAQVIAEETVKLVR